MGRRASASSTPSVNTARRERSASVEAAPAPAVPQVSGPISVDAAERRLGVLLTDAGFRAETTRRADALAIVAERMGTAPPDEAVCGLKALDRPQMYAATLDVSLQPSSGGVQIGVQARFVELDRNLVSGGLVKRSCRSLGVLEARVRRAALGG
jgi:hypothetical protein